MMMFTLGALMYPKYMLNGSRQQEDGPESEEFFKSCKNFKKAINDGAQEGPEQTPKLNQLHVRKVIEIY